ncbi:MAG TPA: adenylate/guanylate cyclase domain-containing protein [Acidimicrobiales bacterium]|nr:adenylate/guanylate cyclase domain-containing protein [Acidimicrobiales bacterium]
MISPPATRYARSGDAHIAYQVVGEGPVDLVLVWGTMSHVELMWEDPFSAYFLERLASFSRLILFDKRGCGLSDRVQGQPSLEQRMDDVRAVMEAVGSEKAAIFGESEGGPMSMMFAATYPERTTALVLYGAFVRWVDDTFEGAVRPHEFEAQVARSMDNWGTGQVIAWFGPTYASFGEELLREGGGRFERAAFSPGAYGELMRLNAQLDARGIVEGIRVPTLVLHRRDDQVVDVRQGRWLSEHIPTARYVELEGNDHLPQVGDPDSVIRHTQEFLTGQRGVDQPDRVLATVLFTDIVGSTQRASELGDARWADLLGRHNALVRAALDRHRGREIKTTGDGFLATFDGPARAIRCAWEIVRSNSSAGIPVRAGLHTGEIEVLGDDIGGIGVHIGQRVTSEAGGGEVLVSQTVKDLVAGSGIEFVDRGTRQFKGVQGRWNLFAVKG